MRFLSLLLALQQAQVHRKRNSYASSIAFSSLEVLPVLHLGRSHPSPSLVFYLLLFLGFYSLYLIELVLSFSKSPSLLKSEFGRKSYHRFRKPRFLPSSVRREFRRRRAVRRKFRREFRRRRTARRTVRGRRNLRRTSPNWCSEAFFGGRRTARRTDRRLARRRRTDRRTCSFLAPTVTFALPIKGASSPMVF